MAKDAASATWGFAVGLAGGFKGKGVFTDIPGPGGGGTHVLDKDVYEKALRRAGDVLREIERKDRPKNAA